MIDDAQIRELAKLLAEWWKIEKPVYANWMELLAAWLYARGVRVLGERHRYAPDLDAICQECGEGPMAQPHVMYRLHEDFNGIHAERGVRVTD